MIKQTKILEIDLEQPNVPLYEQTPIPKLVLIQYKKISDNGKNWTDATQVINIQGKNILWVDSWGFNEQTPNRNIKHKIVSFTCYEDFFAVKNTYDEVVAGENKAFSNLTVYNYNGTKLAFINNTQDKTYTKEDLKQEIKKAKKTSNKTVKDKAD